MRGRPERDRDRAEEQRDLERAVVDDRLRLERPEHEVVAVGEVDQLDDPVDERVAERDERVDHPVREADQRDLDEALGLVDRLADQPVPRPKTRSAPKIQPQRDPTSARLGRATGRLAAVSWVDMYVVKGAGAAPAPSVFVGSPGLVDLLLLCHTQLPSVGLVDGLDAGCRVAVLVERDRSDDACRGGSSRTASRRCPRASRRSG